MKKIKKVIILGAGITGLTVAWKLSIKGYDVHVVESENYVGGLSSGYNYNGISLDFGAHKIYSLMPNIINEIKSLMGNDLTSFNKRSMIRVFDKNFEYPLKMTELLLKINPLVSCKCGFSYFNAMLKNKSNEDTYEEYIINRFGKALYELTFKPIAMKAWGDPRLLSADMAKVRVSIPGLSTMLKNIVCNRHQMNVSSKEAYYPCRCIKQLPEKMASVIVANKGIIQLNSKLTAINFNNNTFKSVEYYTGDNPSNTTKLIGDYLVSTIPLKSLYPLFKPKLPRDIEITIETLKFRNLRILYTVVNKPHVMSYQWAYFPEEKLIFSRISEQKNFSSIIFPEDISILSTDIPCKESDDLWKCSSNDIFNIVVKDYEHLRLLKRKDVIDYFDCRFKDVYPIYELGYKQKIDNVLVKLDSINNFMTLGRQGLFNYNNLDHCMDMGIVAAEHIDSNGSNIDWVVKKKERFSKYVIVD